MARSASRFYKKRETDMRIGFFVDRVGLPALLVSVAAGVASLIVMGCNENPLSPSGNANLTLLLTDDLTDDVQQVNIYFTSITAKPVGKPVQELRLELENNPINLLELDNRVTMLAAGVVEPGAYEFIHINIDQDRSSIVENGVRTSLRIPSEEVKILGNFTVDENHRTTLTLDFDADDSLSRLGNGGWLLRPVIVITGNNVSSRH